MTRQQFLAIIENLTEGIETDIVTQDDDRALAACHFLRFYAVDHMTEADFARLEY